MRHGGLYHASTDGRMLRQVAFGTCLNGIGLSPDGRTAYAAATVERWILGFATDPAAGKQNGAVLANFPGRQFLDSMAMEASGVIAVGCLLERPGIGRVDPHSGAATVIGTPDAMPTNIAFGGADMRDAYITFTERGALAKCRWPTAGMRLPFNL
jgi:gluconolactonase